jgi:hypothetical protein
MIGVTMSGAALTGQDLSLLFFHLVPTFEVNKKVQEHAWLAQYQPSEV